MEKIKGIKKIAVLRANALGDFVFSIPAIRAIKESYPEAEISYLGCPWHAEFLPGRLPEVDRVIVVPFCKGVREGGREEISEQEIFFEKMKKEKFDLALQMHGGGKNSNPFILKMEPKISAGLKTLDAQDLDITIPYVYYQNEMMRFLELARAVGAVTEKIDPEIKVLSKDVLMVKKILKNYFPIAVLHPGASDLRRRWSPQKFAKVGDYLSEKGLKVAITGVSSEENIVEAVQNNMRFRALNLCGKISLPALTGLLSLASLVVSNDTGPLHLAIALNTPTIGIFWCGNLINGGPVSRKFHRPAISWQTNCPFCGKDMASPVFPFENKASNSWEKEGCSHLASFVDNVSAEEVIFYAKEFL